MRRYAYGRRPAVITRRTEVSRLMMAAALDPLGPAPIACNDYRKARGNFGPQMYANDRIGDCTAVDTANRLILRTANASLPVIPTIDQVVDFYSAVSGYVKGDDSTDNGADETAVCAYLVSTGFIGHKAIATSPIDPKKISHIQWGTHLFGGIRLGLNLPGYAEDQFDAGQSWHISPYGDQSTEGHDVPLVDYRNGIFYVDTWGKTIPMTLRALLAWCDEAHAELYPDWIQAQGEAPSGFNLTDLAQKLSEVTS